MEPNDGGGFSRDVEGFGPPSEKLVDFGISNLTLNLWAVVLLFTPEQISTRWPTQLLHPNFQGPS